MAAVTNDEAKAAWRAQSPVVCDGITYTIQSLVYRYPATLLLELLDKNKKCVVIAPPSRVEVKSDDKS